MYIAKYLYIKYLVLFGDIEIDDNFYIWGYNLNNNTLPDKEKIIKIDKHKLDDMVQLNKTTLIYPLGHNEEYIFEKTIPNLLYVLKLWSLTKKSKNRQNKAEFREITAALSRPRSKVKTNKGTKTRWINNSRYQRLTDKNEKEIDDLY